MGDPFKKDDDLFRIELLDQLEPRIEPAIRAFFRLLGHAHVFEEYVVPSLLSREGLVSAVISDRPWPPWGIGAHTIHALTHVHPVTETDAVLSNVFRLDRHVTHLGLIVAV